MSRWRDRIQDVTSRTDESESETRGNGGSVSNDHRADAVGICEDCDTPLPRSHVVIEYETGGEWEQVALCPGCSELAVAESRSRHGQ